MRTRVFSTAFFCYDRHAALTQSGHDAMSHTHHTEQLPPQNFVTCPECGYFSAAQAIECPQCGTKLPREPITTLIRRDPSVQPALTRGKDILPAAAAVILQFYPSGLCEILRLDIPLLLGRIVQTEKLDAPDHQVFDLSEFQAHHHGVSRRHCLLTRRGEHLLATDLGSTNGTYLNDKRLHPNEPQQVAHSDQLTLGTLHLIIYFSEDPDQFTTNGNSADKPIARD